MRQARELPFECVATEIGPMWRTGLVGRRRTTYLSIHRGRSADGLAQGLARHHPPRGRG